MRNGWTGGQYSLARALLGSCLLAGAVLRARAEGPALATAVALAAAGLALLFAAGVYARVAAIALGCAWVALSLEMRGGVEPGILLGPLLWAQACLPPAPYGSWAARGRVDPGGGWRMREGVFLAGWILLAAAYAWSGYLKLRDPAWLTGAALAPLGGAAPWVARGVIAAELGFVPLALARRLRPWLWTLLLAVDLALLPFDHLAGASARLALLLLFTFDPAWVPPRRAAATETLFYDGHCGLCHRAVRFVLAEDRAGDILRFAPLGGETFRAAVPEARRAALPDSLVLVTDAGEVLVRAAGVRHVMKRLGGLWRLLGCLAGAVPARLLDLAYDGIAAVRYRIFGRPADACPLIPKDLRQRFGD